VGDVCPACKERAERDNAKMMNDKAVERIKEVLTQEESDKALAVWFEDDEEVKLRDGKTYKIPPSSLKDARRIMELLKTINVDYVALNFVPSGDDDLDKKRVDGLFEMLEIAFKPYGLKRDFLDDKVDVIAARKICDILIGINGLKK
jgi:uncharacterized protein YfdQ (DUF2303 family)